MSTVHVHGLRGKYSPLNNLSDEHKNFVLDAVNEAKQFADFSVTVRYSTYIGPGCAAERGGICVDKDGGIYAIVFADGHRE